MVYIVGIGPGGKDYILPKATEILEGSNVILGFERAIKSIDFIDTKKIVVRTLKEITDFIESSVGKEISVAASGDPCFYGITNYIKSSCSMEIKVMPGLSSFQYMASKIQKPWQESFLGSLHGRDEDLIDKVKNHKLSIWLTDSKHSPQNIALRLHGQKIDAKMYVGENLSYDDEKITIGKPGELMKSTFSKLCVVMVENNEI